MGSRCVTGRLLLVVVRPDRNVDAPVDGGGRSLTDAPILARSWTPSVARVTAPASSILRDPTRESEAVWFARRKSFEYNSTKFCMPTEPRARRPHPPAINRLSNPPELPNYSIHTLPLTSLLERHTCTPHNMAACPRAGHRAIVKVRVDFSTVAVCASLPTLSRSDRALLTPPRSIGVNPIQNHPLRTHTRSLTLPAHRSARSAATPWLVPCLQPRRMPGGGGDLNS